MKPFALVFALLGCCAGGAWAQSAPRLYGVLDAGLAGAVDAGRQSSLDAAVPADGGAPIYAAVPAGGGAPIYASVDFYSAAPSADAPANRVWGIAVGLEHGRWMIRAAHQNRNIAPVAPATPMGNNTDARNSLLAASVRIGAATAYTAYTAYSVSRGWGGAPLFNPDNPYGAAMATTPSTDSRDVLVGLALARGATTWLASLVRKNDRGPADRDADVLAFGASYALARRTDFYASCSRISVRHGTGAGNGGAAALNLGMRHAF